MKITKLLTVFFIAVLLNACSSNNNDSNDQPQSIVGAWRLTNVSGGITGMSDNFDDGSITWTFNDNGTVDVWNTNTDDTKTDLFETGNYSYGFVPNTTTPQSCAEAILINGISYGCHNISGNTLTLSQVEADGYQVTLEKIQLTTQK
ncbi:MAG: hypothetical protein EOO48_10665 [Flavobacterium sp.]|nr:MAG: hypothetical protein EOO48_10665 [Flavobacterium sp.]